MFTFFEGILWIYFIAAVLPAVILLVLVYRQDKVEQEPLPLVFSLLKYGVLAAVCSFIPELIGESILPNFIDETSANYSIVLAFLVVAVVEEGFKFLFLYKRTWNDPNFNCRFDGIVYAVCVSLGFAAIENLEYVLGYGLAVAPTRALLAIPGHMSFSVFMGVFYGHARLKADQGETAKSKISLIFSYLSAVLLHGFYDSCAMINSSTSNLYFIIFIIIMYVSVFLVIRHESKHDQAI